MYCARDVLLRPSRACIFSGRALWQSQCRAGFATAPVKYALLDVDGNLHDGKRPTPGAIEALARLRPAVQGLLFVTNRSQEGPESLFAKLQTMGFDCQKHEIFSALSAALKLVEQERLRPLLLLARRATDEFQNV